MSAFQFVRAILAYENGRSFGALARAVQRGAHVDIGGRAL